MSDAVEQTFTTLIEAASDYRQRLALDDDHVIVSKVPDWMYDQMAAAGYVATADIQHGVTIVPHSWYELEEQ